MRKVIDFHNTLGNNIPKGLEELSEIERLKLENKRKDIELDILKSTRHWKGSGTSSSHRFSGSIKSKIFNQIDTRSIKHT